MVLGQFLLGANLLGFAESQPQPSNKPVNSTMAKIKQEEDVVALSSGDEVKCEFLSYISQSQIVTRFFYLPVSATANIDMMLA